MKTLVALSIIFSLPFLPLAGTPLPTPEENLPELVYEEEPVVAPETEKALDEAAKEKAAEDPIPENQPSAEEILDPETPEQKAAESNAVFTPGKQPASESPTDEMHQAEATDIADEYIAEKQEASTTARFYNVLLGIGAVVIAAIAITLASTNNGRDASECNKECPCAP